ncbi:sRNA-binding regulator protein Hfq [Anaerocolumna cellulosilytica]|nr:sRNA-binding regulator protein Hfq [Anaerocolumna cellulosilytica]
MEIDLKLNGKDAMIYNVAISRIACDMQWV